MVYFETLSDEVNPKIIYARPFAQKLFFDNCRSVTLTRACNCRSLTFDRAQLPVTHLSSCITSVHISQLFTSLTYFPCLRGVIRDDEGLSTSWSAARSSRMLPRWCPNLDALITRWLSGSILIQFTILDIRIDNVRCLTSSWSSGPHVLINILFFTC